MSNRDGIQKVFLTDGDGDTATITSTGSVNSNVTNTVDVNILSGGGTATVDEDDGVTQATATASGNTEILTVAAGESLTIHQIYVTTGASFVPVQFGVRLTAAGTIKYITNFISRGEREHLIQGPSLTGDVNEDLFINLSVASDLDITITYESA